MRCLRLRRLASKITVVALLASIVALGTLSTAFLIVDTVSSRSQLESRLRTLADALGQNSTAALSFNDPAAANQVLQALDAEPSLVSGCLYDLSGRLFAKYERLGQSQGVRLRPGKDSAYESRIFARDPSGVEPG